MSNHDHAEKLREMAGYEWDKALAWHAQATSLHPACGYSNSGCHGAAIRCEATSASLRAGAEALERVAVLERALAEARKDAERWQFVRKHADQFRIAVSGKRNRRYAVLTTFTSYEFDVFATIDAAIDAAMEGR